MFKKNSAISNDLPAIRARDEKNYHHTARFPESVHKEQPPSAPRDRSSLGLRGLLKLA
jgi:hypothetical protein